MDIQNTSIDSKEVMIKKMSRSVLSRIEALVSDLFMLFFESLTIFFSTFQLRNELKYWKIYIFFFKSSQLESMLKLIKNNCE